MRSRTHGAALARPPRSWCSKPARCSDSGPDRRGRAALGNLERRLALALNPDFNRELTPTDAYILSRVDGKLSAAEVLKLVPQEGGRNGGSLRSPLGLLLTGVVELLEAPPPAEGSTRTVPDAAPPASSAAPIWPTPQGGGGEGGTPRPRSRRRPPEVEREQPSRVSSLGAAR